MKIAVLGTDMVGDAIGAKLIQCGHEVKMGSRTATNEKAAAWVKKNGTHASQETFADAASLGEIVFNCTHGVASLEALNLAGAHNLKNKILIDIANALDFSKGMPPSLVVCNSNSLGEQIQRAFSDTKVITTLNTMNCSLMVNPDLVANGDHDIFISGNDMEAKTTVTKILRDRFGWKSIVDLGATLREIPKSQLQFQDCSIK
jgi:8-hydroxy-5-deazaflavin:NADPH oxidoreductase